MDDYIRARPDVFFTGRDGSLRSNRVLCQLAGQYAVDAFIGSTLQMDGDANSSTVTAGRLAGFGGAPNMGHDPHGRRHASHAWLDLKADSKPHRPGKKVGSANRGDIRRRAGYQRLSRPSMRSKSAGKQACRLRPS
jgi:malonate decarboxylase alpha subunit